jgi:hypothetical protein
MTSLTAILGAFFSGRANGTPTNSRAGSALVSQVNVSLASTSTGASKANESTTLDSFTIAGGGTDTLDLSNYTNVLTETGKSQSKVRLVQIEHVAGSLASAIVVGNGTNPFGGLLTTAAGTFTLKPGEGVIMYSPTTAGMTRDGTHKTILVTNSDGVSAATVKRVVIGEV